MQKLEKISLMAMILGSVFLVVPVSALGGTLSITSTPSGANVYLDNSLKGITPVTLNGLSPGVHEIKLTYMGYEDFVTSVTVALIKNSELAVVLTPVTTTSVPVTAVGGAIIIVNPPQITQKATETQTIASPHITLPTKKSGTKTSLTQGKSINLQPKGGSGKKR